MGEPEKCGLNINKSGNIFENETYELLFPGTFVLSIPPDVVLAVVPPS
jgi:hypothetical protein